MIRKLRSQLGSKDKRDITLTSPWQGVYTTHIGRNDQSSIKGKDILRNSPPAMGPGAHVGGVYRNFEIRLRGSGMHLCRSAYPCFFVHTRLISRRTPLVRTQLRSKFARNME